MNVYLEFLRAETNVPALMLSPKITVDFVTAQEIFFLEKIKLT